MSNKVVDLWLSTMSMTIWVQVDEQGIIRKAAPVAKKFIGQPQLNLEKWMQKQHDFIKKELHRVDL